MSNNSNKRDANPPTRTTRVENNYKKKYCIKTQTNGS